MSSIEGKVAIVTGAASGIGRATAVLLAEKGARVVVADIKEQWAQETMDLIRRAKGQGLFVKTDVRRAADVKNMVEQTVKAFGGVHVLVSNAGLMIPRESIEDMTEEDWDLVVDVSLKGSFLGAKAVYPIMRAQGGGAIIHMSSGGGLGPVVTAPSYASAKAGQINLTRTLAQLFEKDKIRVNCICPGAVATHVRDEYPPAIKARSGPQNLQPEAIARAVYYLATHDTLTGTAVRVLADENKRPEYTMVKSFAYEWAPVVGV